MRTHRLRSRLVAILVAACVASGCTSMQRVSVVTSPTPSARDRVQPGDRVELVMRDGTHARFRVASLDGDALISEEGQRYAREDLRELKVRRPAPGRTANLALAVVTVGLLFLYIRSRPVLGDEFKAW